MTSTRHRRNFGAAIAALTLSVAGCASDDPPPPAEPGGRVDPGAKGVIGGSINKAKGVANDAEERDEQLQDSSTSTP